MTCCPLRFSELSTSSLVGKATPLKTLRKASAKRILRFSQVTQLQTSTRSFPLWSSYGRMPTLDCPTALYLTGSLASLLIGKIQTHSNVNLRVLTWERRTVYCHILYHTIPYHSIHLSYTKETRSDSTLIPQSKVTTCRSLLYRRNQIVLYLDTIG